MIAYLDLVLERYMVEAIAEFAACIPVVPPADSFELWLAIKFDAPVRDLLELAAHLEKFE